MNHDKKLQAIKEIGKEKSEKNLQTLYLVVQGDDSSLVRREAVSSIGRTHSTKAIPILTSILADNDPKIVCQAIRGLLVFKGKKKVDNTLKALSDHPNEMVRRIIRKEYFNEEKKPEQTSHTEIPNFIKDTIVLGDVQETIKHVPTGSIHLTFTSPPYYNARDYSIYPSYEKYLDFLSEVFKEVHRITKEGRFLIVNTSPIIIPRISRQYSSKRYPIPFDLNHRLTETGWEFIDDIIWEKPEFSVKNRIGGFSQHRKPLTYKPNLVTEYLMVYRKQTDRLIDWNIHQYPDQVVEDSKVLDGFETTNIWKVSPKSDKVHSAVFPEELCKRVIEYYSFKGDLVFDPFAGTGTLGKTAQSLGRHFFMTEKDEEFFKYMATTTLKEIGAKFLSQRDFIENINI